MTFIDPSGCWAYYDYEWVELPGEDNKTIKMICYNDDDSVANEYYFDSWDEMYNEVKEKIWDVCDVEFSFDFESWKWWYHWAHDYDQDLLVPVSSSEGFKDVLMYPWSPLQIPDKIPSTPIPRFIPDAPKRNPRPTRQQEQRMEELRKAGEGSAGAFTQEPKGTMAKIFDFFFGSGGGGFTFIVVPEFYSPYYQKTTRQPDL